MHAHGSHKLQILVLYLFEGFVEFTRAANLSPPQTEMLPPMQFPQIVVSMHTYILGNMTILCQLLVGIQFISPYNCMLPFSPYLVLRAPN